MVGLNLQRDTTGLRSGLEPAFALKNVITCLGGYLNRPELY